MKINRIAAAVGAAVLGLASSAQAEISANIGATSNYIWRGVSQTLDGPAVSGGVDYAHDSGFYAGTWISNVDFASPDAGTELDLYAGFGGEISDFGYDVGIIYYAYPQYDDTDFTELYGSLTFGPVTAGLAYTVDTAAGGDDNHLYYYLSGGADVADTWSVGGTVGVYDFDGAGSPSYTHGQIDITKSAGDYGDFTLTFSKVFNDDNVGVDEDVLAVVSWAKTF